MNRSTQIKVVTQSELLSLASPSDVKVHYEVLLQQHNIPSPHRLDINRSETQVYLKKLANQASRALALHLGRRLHSCTYAEIYLHPDLNQDFQLSETLLPSIDTTRVHQIRVNETLLPMEDFARHGAVISLAPAVKSAQAEVERLEILHTTGLDLSPSGPHPIPGDLRLAVARLAAHTALAQHSAPDATATGVLENKRAPEVLALTREWQRRDPR